AGPNGIVVGTDGVNINSLTVKNFDSYPVTSGIQINGQNCQVNGCTLTGNGMGLDLEGAHAIAVGNQINANRVWGCVLDNTDQQVRSNTCNLNGSLGILVWEGGNTVRDNTASYNLGDGIHTSTSTSEFGGHGIESNLISGNTVVGNLQNGIDV